MPQDAFSRDSHYAIDCELQLGGSHKCGASPQQGLLQLGQGAGTDERF
jgi:hypothetical protein